MLIWPVLLCVHLKVQTTGSFWLIAWLFGDWWPRLSPSFNCKTLQIGPQQQDNTHRQGKIKARLCFSTDSYHLVNLRLKGAASVTGMSCAVLTFKSQTGLRNGGMSNREGWTGRRPQGDAVMKRGNDTYREGVEEKDCQAEMSMACHNERI